VRLNERPAREGSLDEAQSRFHMTRLLQLLSLHLEKMSECSCFGGEEQTGGRFQRYRACAALPKRRHQGRDQMRWEGLVEESLIEGWDLQDAKWRERARGRPASAAPVMTKMLWLERASLMVWDARKTRRLLENLAHSHDQHHHAHQLHREA